MLYSILDFEHCETRDRALEFLLPIGFHLGIQYVKVKYSYTVGIPHSDFEHSRNQRQGS